MSVLHEGFLDANNHLEAQAFRDVLQDADLHHVAVALLVLVLAGEVPGGSVPGLLGVAVGVDGDVRDLFDVGGVDRGLQRGGEVADAVRALGLGEDLDSEAVVGQGCQREDSEDEEDSFHWFDFYS